MEAADYYQLIANRQSDRAFDTARPVEADKLARILEAGRMAPSACNGQPWHFIAITDPTLRASVAQAIHSVGMNRFALQAQAFILIVEEGTNVTSWLGGMVKSTHYPHIDIGIAVAQMTLACEAEGLGSCILGYFDEKKLKRLVGIPRRKRLALVLALGYAAKEKRKKIRKPAEEVISYNQYK